jgi:hypothetical protein
MGISVSSVETIINDELNFSTISTHWVPKLSSNKQKKDKLKFQLIFWNILKEKVTHFCIH